ncbi:unnamed protein product, partial [Allacma fusca]
VLTLRIVGTTAKTGLECLRRKFLTKID